MSTNRKQCVIYDIRDIRIKQATSPVFFAFMFIQLNVYLWGFRVFTSMRA